jgi:hypothetical protein
MAIDEAKLAAPAQDGYEEQVVTARLQEFGELNLWRSTTASHWEEIAELIDPASRNTFYYGNYNWPGQKKTDRQVDATGMMALGRFSAILDSLLTPRNQLWHQLASDDTDVMANRDARLWYEQATKIAFQERYDAIANFTAGNQQVYYSLGAYGTGGLFIDQAYDDWNKPVNKLRYKNIPIGELFIRENHQGRIDSVIRWFKLTARQAFQKFGENIPAMLLAAMQQKSENMYDFLHCVQPRTDYEEGSWGPKGMPYSSQYISIQGRALLAEGGFRSFPYAIGRYVQTPMETYGRSPAMQVLPALKTLNAEKATFLKVGHRAADPTLLTYDDGLVDPTMKPGAINKGGMSAEGRPLIGILPTGQIQVTKEMMDEERALINDAFLVTLFQILTETPTMTATEVIERTNEKGILIAPTVGRQQSEYLGPLIHRELDLLVRMRKLPPMPDIVKRHGAYNVVYTSPLARAQRAQDVAGLQRTIQSVLEVVNATQDPSPLDVFNFDVSTRETAMIQAVPERWLNDDNTIAQKRKSRAQEAQRQAQLQALPAQAAMIKAQATVQKAGGPPPQPGGGQPQQGVPQQQPQGPGGPGGQ